MRSFRHWTPRYINNRIALFCYEKANPDYPWLTRSANEILESYLTKSDIGLEFGSGRSTLWFAKHVEHLTSVEHDPLWSGRVQKMLAGIKNVDYRFRPKDVKDEEGEKAEYVKVIDTFNNNSLDFCLVDGTYREFCVLKVIEKIRPGGIVILDNVNWYLPHTTFSPDSRSLADGPNGPVWKEVDRLLSGWRRIWTSSGVTDTAIFFKPC